MASTVPLSLLQPRRLHDGTPEASDGNLTPPPPILRAPASSTPSTTSKSLSVLQTQQAKRSAAPSANVFKKEPLVKPTTKKKVDSTRGAYASVPLPSARPSSSSDFSEFSEFSDPEPQYSATPQRRQRAVGGGEGEQVPGGGESASDEEQEEEKEGRPPRTQQKKRKRLMWVLVAGGISIVAIIAIVVTIITLLVRLQILPSYDVIANATSCTTGGIACLRALSADALLNATNLLPNLNAVSSLAIPFLPRTDYSFVSETADKLVAERRFAQNVSIISGNQYDEGTILTLGTGLNITTSEALDNWLATTFSTNSTAEQRQRLLELYPEDVTQGSPFDTGDLYALAPQSKRIAALLGDMVFQGPRRAFLNQTKETQPTWAYSSRAFRNTPVIGSFHSSDVLSLYGARPGAPGDEMRQRWIEFTYNLNPNVEGYIDWPEYKNNYTLLELTDSNSTTVTDDYRKEQMDYIISIESNLIV
ncbi:hypothetical protein JCM16303_003029 [Sporobolomyces ruberrimus]